MHLVLSPESARNTLLRFNSASADDIRQQLGFADFIRNVIAALAPPDSQSKARRSLGFGETVLDDLPISPLLPLAAVIAVSPRTIQSYAGFVGVRPDGNVAFEAARNAPVPLAQPIVINLVRQKLSPHFLG